jgi:cephalosporin-C deacetylase-like acetyl esterase
MFLRLALLAFCWISLTSFALATDKSQLDTSRGDKMLADYFRRETDSIASNCLADIKTLEDWTSRREGYRRQLFEMLGLDPLPERTPLEAKTTGTVDHAEFTVEKVVFQSRPGLYVTANLYIPKGLSGPAPTVLYVCGHGNVKKDGVSYGSKASYQHHPAWFARHGYVSLVLDTLQLGEIEGLHHGTYRENMWWWNCRGYTPAGVEAWNCIRALDYLQSRKEVDGQRIGVTGRSGGGAYSWWIAALDERIKAAVPVAGITDLENHVVDGCVEGHCDCMYMVNTYRWDYAKVAALVAPRPLLLSNTDKDGIFPLEGVERVHQQVRRIYRLYGADAKFGLQISEGPHKDIQELQVAAFRWFNRFLKGEDPLIEKAAVKFFEPEQLKVFTELPKDQINTQIQETFTVQAPAPALPQSPSDWEALRDGRMKELREKCFAGWPQQAGPLDLKLAFESEREGVHLAAFDFTSQPGIRLRLYVAHRPKLARPDLSVVNVLDDQEWKEWLAMMRPEFSDELKEEMPTDKDPAAFAELSGMFKAFPWAMAYVAPRGVGPTAWDQSAKKQIQNRRRFMLLGQTLEGMQVWDVRRAVQAVRELPLVADSPVWLQGHRQAAGLALYASLFESKIARLDLWQLPTTHRDGPYFLNVLRYLDLPLAVAMAAERSKLRLYETKSEAWTYPAEVTKRLDWDAKQFQIRELKAKPPEKPKQSS